MAGAPCYRDYRGCHIPIAAWLFIPILSRHLRHGRSLHPGNRAHNGHTQLLHAAPIPPGRAAPLSPRLPASRKPKFFILFYFFFPGAARLCVLEHRCLAMSLSNAAASAQSPPCGGCWGGTDVTAGTRSHPHPSSPRGVPSAAASPHAALSVPRMPRDAFPSPETLPWCWL